MATAIYPLVKVGLGITMFLTDAGIGGVFDIEAGSGVRWQFTRRSGISF